MKNSKNAMLKLACVSLLALSATFSGIASAGPMLGQTPDPSVIVSAGDYEWVYAGPCAGEAPSCAPVLLHHDFGFATNAQWNASFANIDALLTAFQFNQSTGTGLCAAAYFNTIYSQCDFRDAAAGYIWQSPLALSEAHRTNPAGETFLVRGVAGSADVPEPASLALVGLGLAGIAAARRKSSK